MKKAIFAAFALICAVCFIIGASAIGAIANSRLSARKTYSGTSEAVTAEAAEATTKPAAVTAKPEPTEEPEDDLEVVVPPKRIDFDKLLEQNPEVVGWLYCEGTMIDYPVLQGTDNDFYLKHDVNGDYSVSGSIFVECLNAPNFGDYNTIIYGHHMADGSMLAGIDNYRNQEYYDEHPMMWLFTPNQDYQILLFSGYVTPSISEAYGIYSAPGMMLDAYIRAAVEKSNFKADVELTGTDRFVLLSTCNYNYEGARYVVHGLLHPVRLADDYGEAIINLEEK